ncbi:MAG: tryptophan-rich sensory protein [Syntrophomonadaceae bacterium]|jgi:FtsH-binding integral membrane protein|nr:tryptophan-rich sensory protein [Syntrophomonadaceae bacterium]
MVQILAVLVYLVMVIVNGLANTLPLNGVTTGEVSEAYQNLFAPAGITFVIWGLIYLLLAVYVLYQVGLFQGDKSDVKGELLNKVGLLFIVSSLANAAWIFAWHYDLISLSMILMIVILLSLIYTMKYILQEELNSKEKFMIKLPFSVYFGWITVATIANATVLLVSLNWNGFNIAEPIWAVIIIITGMLIGGAVSIRYKDAVYSLVLVWAYAGIYIKHVSAAGFAGQYPSVITTVIICIIVLLAISAYSFITRRRHTGTLFL